MRTEMLTIVIPAKNEEGYIGKMLESLTRQTCISPQTPVFIADAGSTDRTLDVISNYSDHLNIQVVPGGLPPVGRNQGARYACSRYVLFLDADIELGEPDTIEKSLQLAEKRRLDLVTTYIRCRNARWLDRLLWAAHGLASRTRLFGAFGAGLFILMRNEAYKRLGGFNEQIALGEDWDLTHRVAPRKFCISNTFIYTTNRRFLKQGYLKTFAQYLMVAFSKKYRDRGNFSYFDMEY